MQKKSFFHPTFLVLPAFLMSASIILWPLIVLGRFSISHVNRFGMVRGFAGLENYFLVFQDPLLYESLFRTGIWTIGVVGGTLLIAMPVAILLHEDFIGRDLVRVIVMLPWAVSLAMYAIVGRWALNGESGLFNLALSDLGMIQENVAWLGTATTAFPAQIVIGIIASVPFTTTIFLGGISSISHDFYEAARVEGVTPWHAFRYITLPLMRPFINIAVVLNTIYVFNSFPIIWATTEGGPFNSTDILVTYLYKLAFRFGRMGEAAVLSLIMFTILLLFTLIYVRMMTKEDLT